MSIVKFFSDSEIRFVEHPAGKYGFGIVAVDFADVLEIQNSHQLPVKDKYKGVANITTPGGVQSMTVIWEPGVYEVLGKSRKRKAELFQDWLYEVVLPSIRKTGSYSVSPVDAKIALQPVTDETIRVHTASVQFFTNNGDLQLAQLVKARFGNLLLAEQQNLFKPADVPQYEGAMDVAIRLGFKVPPRFEGSLGTDVKKHCAHLIIGHDERYSLASSKKVPANMYPAGNPEVEQAVLDYCVSKAFHRSDIKFIA